jgi:hypothetical protein
MSDGIGVDFSLLKTPDYLGDYQNAFDVGRKLAEEGVSGSAATPNAFAPRPPVSGENPLAPLDGLTGPARSRALEQADLLVNLGAGLKGFDYGERRAVLAHMAPALAARGVPPSALAAFDPTDQNLDEAVGAASAALSRLAPTPD